MTYSSDLDFFHTVLCETLKQTLGENPAKALLYHTGVRNSAVEIKEFVNILEEKYGPGADVLERRILENLFSAVGKTFTERKDSEFIDYVNEVKKLV